MEKTRTFIVSLCIIGALLFTAMYYIHKMELPKEYESELFARCNAAGGKYSVYCSNLSWEKDTCDVSCKLPERYTFDIKVKK